MKQQKPIILFDGLCNLCNGTLNFILKMDKKKQFQFVALQSKKGKELIEKYKTLQETDSVILIYKNEIFIESDAAVEISKLLPFPWNWAGVFGFIPKKWRDKIYRWIAKNRYRWFGKRNSCRVI